MNAPFPSPQNSRPCALCKIRRNKGRSISVLSEQYETSYLFYVTLSSLCNIICYLISVFVFSLVTLSGATTVDNRLQKLKYLAWLQAPDSLPSVMCDAVYLSNLVFCFSQVGGNYIKVGDHGRRWPEGSLFNSYYTKEGATPFPGLLHFTLDLYVIMLSVKQGGIKHHFYSLWYDSTEDWTPVSQ